MSKPAVIRWKRRYAAEGVAGLDELLENGATVLPDGMHHRRWHGAETTPAQRYDSADGLAPTGSARATDRHRARPGGRQPHACTECRCRTSLVTPCLRRPYQASTYASMRRAPSRRPPDVRSCTCSRYGAVAAGSTGPDKVGALTLLGSSSGTPPLARLGQDRARTEQESRSDALGAAVASASRRRPS